MVEIISDWIPIVIGTIYILFGLIGLLLNFTTVVMILTRRVYRLSAYTIMANVALADAFIMIVTGCVCGITIIYSNKLSSSTIIADQNYQINKFANFLNDKNYSFILTEKNKRSSFNSNKQEENLVDNKIYLSLPKQLISNYNISLVNKNIKNMSGVQALEQSHSLFNQNNFISNTLIMTPAPPIIKQYLTNFQKRRRRKRFWQLYNNFKKQRERRKEKNSISNHKTIFLNKKNLKQKRTFDDKQNFFKKNLIPQKGFVNVLTCFIKITAWTTSIISYAILGLNRCVAICFYGTKAKTFNRVSVAIISSGLTWIIAICAAFLGTFPVPLVQTRLELWSVSYEILDGKRPVIFICVSLLIYTISISLQWICSTLVLLKIHQVRKKISKNKLNLNSANRFRKQARLTFQFFYPSLFCTILSILYFAKPFLKHILSDLHLIILHLIWLSNHMCNPFIYAYFNDRMRLSYYEILSCARLRLAIIKQKNRKLFNLNNFSKRSTHHRIAQQMSVRSVGAASNKSNGNFVRNSLQIQSRDFEQLCEFMMRVNPLYDSSEGWRESSDDEDSYIENKAIDLLVRKSPSIKNGENSLSFARQNGPLNAIDFKAHNEGILNGSYNLTAFKLQKQHRSSRSIVLDFKRQTVEHWAAFAKKASI